MFVCYLLRRFAFRWDSTSAQYFGASCLGPEAPEGFRVLLYGCSVTAKPRLRHSRHVQRSACVEYEHNSSCCIRPSLCLIQEAPVECCLLAHSHCSPMAPFIQQAEQYWTVKALLETAEGQMIAATLTKVDGKRYSFWIAAAIDSAPLCCLGAFIVSGPSMKHLIRLPGCCAESVRGDSTARRKPSVRWIG